MIQLTDIRCLSESTQVKARRFGLGLVAATFFAILGLQLLRTIHIDSYQMQETRLDILGYWMAQGVGFLLTLYMLHTRRLMVVPAFFVGMMIVYTSVVVFTTGSGISLVGFLVSRFGLLMWFSLGLAAGGMIHVMQRARVRGKGAKHRRVALIVLGIIAMLALDFSVGYFETFARTISYQPVANNSVILLLISIFVIEALWADKKPIWLVISYFVIGTVLAVAVASMQSTSIVVLWGVICLVLGLNVFMKLRVFWRLMLPPILLAALFAVWQSDIFIFWLERTRFAGVLDGDIGLSSVSTRLAILDSFNDQFAIAPLLGHFRAEILAGTGVGLYVHNIPLSILTHTGIVGFGIILVPIVATMIPRLTGSRMDISEYQITRYIVILLVVGAQYTFFTWSIFWFLLGVLCKRPLLRDGCHQQRNAA